MRAARVLDMLLLLQRRGRMTARELAAEANRLSTWFLRDPDPWDGNRIPHGELRRIARSIHEHRSIEVTIDHEPAITVRPLALVLKAGSWYLIASGDTTVEVICID